MSTAKYAFEHFVMSVSREVKVLPRLSERDREEMSPHTRQHLGLARLARVEEPAYNVRQHLPFHPLGRGALGHVSCVRWRLIACLPATLTHFYSFIRDSRDGDMLVDMGLMPKYSMGH